MGTETRWETEIEITHAQRTLEEIVIDVTDIKYHHFENIQIATNFIIVFLQAKYFIGKQVGTFWELLKPIFPSGRY